ncbi:MAG: methyltransferase [Bacteroidota bacterium]
MNNAKVKAPPANMRLMMSQMVTSKCLGIAAELGIADMVGTGPQSVDHLSQELNLDSDALHRLIRLLASQGIFSIDGNGMVSNSEVSDFLKDDIMGSQRNFARMMGSSWMWQVFNHLEHSLETGNSAFESAYDDTPNIFEYFKKVSPQDGKVFGQAMSGFSYAFDKPLIDSYDFSEVQHVVDLGGAEGRLLKYLKSVYPKIDASLFDLPDMITQARAADPKGVLNMVEGDFFKKVEPSADCYIIKYVLHNWTDEACLKIMENCRQSITDNGRVLIMDILIKEDEPQVTEKSMDLVMLMVLGAKERTREQFEELLTKTSFKINRIIPTKTPLSIIEVLPV